MKTFFRGQGKVLHINEKKRSFLLIRAYIRNFSFRVIAISCKIPGLFRCSKQRNKL